MAEFPGFTIWTDAYLADTGDLTAIEHGAYLMLLIAMWRSGGHLPDNDAKLAKVARLTPRQWPAVREAIWHYFTAENGTITQGRLLDELAKARMRSQKAADSARAKHRKSNDVGAANARSEHSSKPASITTSTSIAIEEDTSLRSVAPSAQKSTPRSELENVLDEARSAAVVEHRQRLRKPLTAYAASKLAEQFANCPDPNAAADAMITNGWQGFKSEWMDRSNGPGNRSSQPGANRAHQKLMRSFGFEPNSDE